MNFERTFERTRASGGMSLSFDSGQSQGQGQYHQQQQSLEFDHRNAVRRSVTTTTGPGPSSRDEGHGRRVEYADFSPPLAYRRDSYPPTMTMGMGRDFMDVNISDEMHHRGLRMSQGAPMLGGSGLGENINIFEMAAELVAKRLEQKLTPTAPPPPRISGPTQRFEEDPRYQPSRPEQVELITGVVTQMQESYGMISSEVFFMLDKVTGPIPVVGDKVVVEATAVTGMPFKFTAKRVQVISKDLTSGQKNMTSRFVPIPEVDVNFGPLPKMPSSLKLLGKEKDKSSSKTDRDRDRQKEKDRSASSREMMRMMDSVRELPAQYQPVVFGLNLSGDVPVLKSTSSSSAKRKSKSRSRSPKSKRRRSRSRSRSRSKPRRRRSRSRSRSRSRGRRSRKTRSRSRDRRRVRKSKSPSRRQKSPRSKRDDDIQVIGEYITPSRPGQQDQMREREPVLSHHLSPPTSSEDRKPNKRPPRSFEALLRHHLPATASEGERFVPNPCATKMAPQAPKQPSVTYLHNPALETGSVPIRQRRMNPTSNLADERVPQQYGLGQRDLDIDDDVVSKKMKSLSQYLNEQQLSAIEQKRFELQKQKQKLESEIKRSRAGLKATQAPVTGKSDKRGGTTSGDVSRKEQERQNRGAEGPVKRIEMGDINRKKEVEWITKSEMEKERDVFLKDRDRSTTERRRSRSREKTDRVPRDRKSEAAGRQPKSDRELHWELPKISEKEASLRRQEDELSQRERDILERMWVIKSQKRK